LGGEGTLPLKKQLTKMSEKNKKKGTKVHPKNLPRGFISRLRDPQTKKGRFHRVN